MTTSSAPSNSSPDNALHTGLPSPMVRATGAVDGEALRLIEAGAGRMYAGGGAAYALATAARISRFSCCDCEFGFWYGAGTTAFVIAALKAALIATAHTCEEKDMADSPGARSSKKRSAG